MVRAEFLSFKAAHHWISLEVWQNCSLQQACPERRCYHLLRGKASGWLVSSFQKEDDNLEALKLKEAD